MSELLKVQLHPKAAKQLESYLEELITNATFEYEIRDDDGYYDVTGSNVWHLFVFYDPAMEKIKKLMFHLDYFAGDFIWSICNLVLGYLFKERDIVRTKVPNYDTPWDLQPDYYEIKDYIDKEFVTTAKQMLLDYFDSLPFEYRVFAPLPQVHLPDNKPFVISDKIKLLKLEQDPNSNDSPPLIAKWPPEYSAHTMDGKDISKDGIAYVALKLYGSGIDSHINPLFRNTLETLKILTAALYAINVLSENAFRRIIDPPDSRGCCFIYPSEEHRKPSFLKEQVSVIKIAEMEWDLIDRLDLDSSSLEPNQLELAAIKSGKKKDSPVEKHKRLEQKISPTRKLFVLHSQPEKKREVDRVRNALHWFFEGIANHNESFSFIQLTIAMETLLGEPNEKKDVVKRLADRCSFLIATDAIQRKEIKKDFEAAYSVRSKIIHEGKAQFDKEEMIHYTNMREFLMEALAIEIESLPDV